MRLLDKFMDGLLVALLALKRYLVSMAKFLWRILVWKIPKYSRLMLLLQASVILVTWVVMQLWPQIPDVPVYSLGVVAALMSIEGLSRPERAVCIFLVFGLFIVELKYSYKERITTDAQMTSRFKVVSDQANSNLNRILQSEDNRFAAILRNQQKEFDITIGRIERDEKTQATAFNDIVGRENTLFEQSQKMLSAQESMRIIEEQAALNSEEATLQLNAMSEAEARQKQAAVTETPSMNPLPSAEAQDTKKLKVQALRLARDINNWIAAVSKDGPKLSRVYPQTKDEQNAVEAFSDRLSKEWVERFNGPANDMVVKLHIVGLLMSCNPGTREILPSDTLRYRSTCANAIQREALKLK